MGTGSLTISQFPHLLDESFNISQMDYAAVEVKYPYIFDTAPPPGFDPAKPIWRMQRNYFDSHVDDDWRPGQRTKETGGAEDYWVQARVRYLRNKLPIVEDISKLSESRLWDIVSSWMSQTAINHARKLDKIAASVFNNGMLTAGHSVFNNNEPTKDGTGAAPNSLFIYDGLPFYDTAHWRNAQEVAGETFSNHDASLTPWSRANMQTIWTRMTITNAKDYNGEQIDIMPNAVIYNGTQKFNIEADLGASVADADLQPNVIGQQGLRPLEWNLIDSTTGFFVSELKKGKRLFPWGTPYFETDYNTDTHTNYIYYTTPFGIVITDPRYDYCAGIPAA